MAHSALLCQDCFAEIQLGDVATDSGVVCPNCGSESFRI
jgi:DNA-directed RNA polymerase subunit RPC12/RpoP